MRWIVGTGADAKPMLQASGSPPSARLLGWIAATFLVSTILTALVVWGMLGPGPAASPTVTRFQVTLPGSDVIGFNGGLALSPDGEKFVYAATRNQVQQLFVRARDEVEATPIRGTEGATHPFFSPDGNEVGFFASNELKRVSLSSGSVMTLSSVGGRLGASWGPDDTIIFASDTAPGLMRIAAAGGEPETLTVPTDEGERHNWPEFLPDGTAVLFTISQQGPISDKRVAILSLETLTLHVLEDGTDAHFASSGHLVFARTGSLWAAPFDPETLKLTGEPILMLADVRVNAGGGWAFYTLANEGSLVYLSASSASQTLVWVDRDGTEEELTIPPGNYIEPRISPDGKQVAFSLNDPEDQGIRVWDLTRGDMTHLSEGLALSPLWTPDGQRIVFSGERNIGGLDLFWKKADGTGSIEELASNPEQDLRAYSWSGDGNTLALWESNANNISQLSIDGDSKRSLLLQESFGVSVPAISPDGRWMAYQSAEEGTPEIWVRPYPEVDSGRWPVGAGFGPVWSRQGTELFYRADGFMMRVAVESEPTFSAGIPERVFPDSYDVGGDGRREYDVSPDGQRFLMIKQATTDRRTIEWILNWTEELKRLAPTDN
jgi:serine/threonine-protein kinase